LGRGVRAAVGGGAVEHAMSGRPGAGLAGSVLGGLWLPVLDSCLGLPYLT